MTKEALNFSPKIFTYERRSPGETPLYQVIDQNYKGVLKGIEQEKRVPFFVANEFEKFLKCGILSEGFVRMHCPTCNHNHVLAFSCKGRGICPSCGARRMIDTADHLVNHVFPNARIRQWVISFPFQLRYLMAYDAEKLNKILAIVIRAIKGFYRNKAKAKGIKKAEFGAVAFIQRFGSMNLNVHFHILFADGAFYKNENDRIIFEHSKKPSTDEIEQVNSLIKKRAMRYLKKEGIVQDYEEGNSQFEYQSPDDGLGSIYQNSIQRKISSGKNRGHRIERVGSTFTTTWKTNTGKRCSYIDGFSLHANVDVAAGAREKLENLIKYTARPALANSRISQDASGHILYELKNRYTDGTTHLRFSPREFIAKIIALIPPPRKNLIRFFGVFGPHHRYREAVTDLIRKKPQVVMEIESSDADGVLALKPESLLEQIPEKPNYWIPWAELLKKTFNIDALKCSKCGSKMKVADYVCKVEEIKTVLLSLGEEMVTRKDSIDNKNSTVRSYPAYQYDYEYFDQGPPLF